MELFQELLSTLFIILGVIFMMIAALGILRLPDFYIRMSAITKAGTMGVGLIVVGIAIYFNDLLISVKSFVIVSFMLLTAPVGAHIIARAAYRQGIPFWGKNLVDELGDAVKNLKECEEAIAREPDNIKAKMDILKYYASTPPVLGGSLRKAMLVACEIMELDAAEGHCALGMVYEKDKDYNLAEEEYKSALTTSGGLNRYRYRLGLFYQEAEWFEKAFGVFEEILTKDPRQSRALFELGKTAALSGMQYERGEEALNAYLTNENAPDRHFLAQASLYLGIIFLKQEEYIMAGEYFEKALDYDPLLREARYYLDKIRKRAR